MMTKNLNNNSSPSGYDSRYHTASQGISSKFDDENTLVSSEIIESQIEKQKEYVKVYIQQSQSDNTQENEKKNDEKILEKRTTEYIKKEFVESLSDISQLKVSFIVRIIKRKLAVMHRVKNHRLLKDKKIPDSLIIEREIEKRATLNIVDMLAILKFTDKHKEMTTQQKVLLLNELNKNVKLTVDEKLAIVTRIIKSNIVEDTNSCKHLKNKLTLLFIVKESGFSIDVTRVKGYKPLMNEVEETEIENNHPTEEKLVSQITIDDTTSQADESDIEKADFEVLAYDSLEADNTTDVQPTQSELGVESSKKSTKAVAKVKIKAKTKTDAMPKQPAKKQQITKTFVNSKRHFKFGAGYIAKNNVLTILLPSGYILDKNRVYQSNILCNGVVSNANVLKSPLSITFTKTKKINSYSLFDFYNSNLIECRDNSLKYRNTVISKSPAVLKHKPNSNVYTASVFIQESKLVYDIKFSFKKTVANTASTVNRILASILFEGM